MSCYEIMSGLVLLVTDMLHPVDNIACFLFLDGDVRHGAEGPYAHLLEFALPMRLLQMFFSFVFRIQTFQLIGPASSSLIGWPDNLRTSLICP